MDEIGLLRAQLALARERLLAVGRACTEVLGGRHLASDPAREDELLDAAIAYLCASLAAFDERDQRLGEIGRLRFAAGGPQERMLVSALAAAGSGREVLSALEAASAAMRAGGTAHAHWRTFEQLLLGAWLTRRTTLDQLLGQLDRVADWRAIANLDADAILAERQRLDALRRLLPAGIGL